MSIKKIITAIDTQLREKSVAVHTIDAEIIALCNDMIDTMHAANGLGLAAPQVGVLARVVVIDFGYIEHDELVEQGKKREDDPFDSNPLALINPEITAINQEAYTMEEGCLSIPHYRGKVSRPSKLSLKYLTLDGKRETKTLTNLGASAVQHEIDHLDGILFIDHIGRLKRNSAMRGVKKFLATVEEIGSDNERRLYGNA